MWHLLSKLVRSAACGSQTVTPSESDANTLDDQQEGNDNNAELTENHNKHIAVDNSKVDTANIVQGKYKKFFVAPVQDLVLTKEIKLVSNTETNIFDNQVLDEDNNIIQISRFTVAPVKSQDSFVEVCLKDGYKTNNIDLLNTLESDTLLSPNITQKLDFISYASSSNDIGKNHNVLDEYSQLPGNTQSNNFDRNVQSLEYMQECDENKITNDTKLLTDDTNNGLEIGPKEIEEKSDDKSIITTENAPSEKYNTDTNLLQKEQEIQKNNLPEEETKLPNEPILNRHESSDQSKAFEETVNNVSVRRKNSYQYSILFGEVEKEIASDNFIFHSAKDSKRSKKTSIQFDPNLQIEPEISRSSKKENLDLSEHSHSAQNLKIIPNNTDQSESKVDQLQDSDASEIPNNNLQNNNTIEQNTSNVVDLNETNSESSKNTYRDILDRYNPLGDNSSDIKFTYEYAHTRPKFKMLKRRASKRFVLSESGEEPTWSNEKSTDPKTITQEVKPADNASNNIK